MLERQYIPLTAVDANIHILANQATTTIRQTFANASDKLIRDVRYDFPIFAGVSIGSFTASIGNKTLKGVVRPNEEAEATYEKAKKEGKQAAWMRESKDSGDVFTTNIANIQPKSWVVVEITYVQVLDQDFDVNGYRYTLPTSIAPRYGAGMISPELHTSPDDEMSTKMKITGGIKIVVDVETAVGNEIRTLGSPSHTIQFSIGRLHNETESAVPSFSKGHVALTNSTVAMDKDFIVQYQPTKPEASSAILETYKHDPRSKAIMATIVPNNAPSNIIRAHRQVIIVLDLSGSMHYCDRIDPMVTAVTAFLNSLKTCKNTSFNIVGFGSRYEYLWDEDKPVTHDNCKAAIKGVDDLVDYDMGGTELQKAFDSVFKRQKPDSEMEVILFTDAEVEQVNLSKEEVKKSIDKSGNSIRIFTLGIGDRVSHELIKGLAQVSNGFSLACLNNERFDKEMLAIFKAMKTPHIKEYLVDVKYADGRSERVSQGQFTPPSATETGVSFFPDDFVGRNGRCTTKVLQTEFQGAMTGSYMEAEEPVNTFLVPTIIQSPLVVPIMCASHQSSLYLLLRNSTAEVKSIVLTSVLRDSDMEIVTEVPVTTLTEHGESIHQLAAKAFSKEMETRGGWISKINREGGDRLDLFDTSLVRTGVHFGIPNSMTSFIAVEKEPNPDVMEVDTEADADAKVKSLDETDVDTLGGDEWDVVDISDRGSDQYSSSAARGGQLLRYGRGVPAGSLCSITPVRSKARGASPTYQARGAFLCSVGGDDDDDSDDSEQESFAIPGSQSQAAAGPQLGTDKVQGLLDLQSDDYSWSPAKESYSESHLSFYCGLNDLNAAINGVKAALADGGFTLQDSANIVTVATTLLVVSYLQVHQEDASAQWEILVEEAIEWLQSQFTADDLNTTDVFSRVKGVLQKLCPS